MNRNEVLHKSEAIDKVSGVELLKEAIIYEHTTCLDTLPYVYTPYFSEPLSIILHRSTTYLRRWFLIIRSGREASCAYPRLEKFYPETYLRSWVSLKKKQCSITGSIYIQCRIRTLCYLNETPYDLLPCDFQ